MSDLATAVTAAPAVWPITFDDVLAARERIRPYLVPTPLRTYAPLDEAVGGGVRVHAKHENHNPTGAFKVRNALSAMTALSDEQRGRGVVAASRGNHGQGLAYAGRLLGVPVTVCVPRGNNPEKNEAIRGFGAELVEVGAGYDESAEHAAALVAERGMHLVHSTNDAHVIAGAGTLFAEMLEEEGALDALVVSVGGGSQAVGAMVAARRLRPGLRIYGVGAERAPGTCRSWHARVPAPLPVGETIADGLATRGAYPMTFGAMLEGLSGFVEVSEEEIAAAVRLLLRTTHNLAEGAGAAGLAGVMKLREELAGMRVGIVISGGNIDLGTLRGVLES